MISNLVPSLIRTYVPLAVGWLVAWLSGIGVQVDSAQFELALSAGLAAGYYALVRLLERRWPALGWLLGHPSQPSYAPLTGPAPVASAKGTKTAKGK